MYYRCITFAFYFFLNDTATTEIYTYLHTLSLHDALPILQAQARHRPPLHGLRDACKTRCSLPGRGPAQSPHRAEAVSWRGTNSAPKPSADLGRDRHRATRRHRLDRGHGPLRPGSTVRPAG